MPARERLNRRHWLLAPEQIDTVRQISEREQISGSEVVRRAIEAYDPNFDCERELEAALEVMGESIRDTRSQLAALRERLDETTSDAYRERLRKQARDEVRAHFVAHPEELDAVADHLGWQR